MMMEEANWRGEVVPMFIFLLLAVFFSCSRTNNLGRASLFNDAFHGMTIARDRRVVVEDLGDIRRCKGALFCM